MEDSKERDLSAYAKCIIHHKSRQLIGKFGFTRDDCEDLQQEMALDLLVRLPMYDPCKASLKTFIARLVDRKISKIIRHRKQQKRDYRCEACSLDDPIENQEGGGVTRGETVSTDEHDMRWGKYLRPQGDRVDLRLDISFALSELPADLRRLAECLSTSSVTQAARELGVPKKAIEAGIAQLRNLLQDKELEKYL